MIKNQLPWNITFIFLIKWIEQIGSFDVYKCKIGGKIVLLLLNVFGESFVKVIRSVLVKVGPQICNLIAKLGSSWCIGYLIHQLYNISRWRLRTLQIMNTTNSIESLPRCCNVWVAVQTLFRVTNLCIKIIHKASFMNIPERNMSNTKKYECSY